MENLNQLGTTIYLERTPKELFQRVKQATNSRPLIAHKTDEELLEYIESTMEKRREIYLKSKIIADRFSQTPEKLIELIQKFPQVIVFYSKMISKLMVIILEEVLVI